MGKDVAMSRCRVNLKVLRKMPFWKIDKFMPFHFGILEEFLKMTRHPDIPTSFSLMFRQVDGPFLQIDDGRLIDDFSNPHSCSATLLITDQNGSFRS